MRPACVRMGFGEAPPKFSVVALLCDFGNPALGICAVRCVAGLRNTVPPDVEIIFVVNGPSDNLSKELQHVAQTDPRVIVISTSENLGVVAKNLGYEVAQGEYIFSIDGDVVVRETRAFTKCLDLMEANPKAAIIGPCGGRLVDDGWGIDRWGVNFDKDGKHVCGYDDPVDFGGNEEFDGELVDSVPSMFWCFRRKLLREIGPLDWRFGPFVGSDSDFCFRAKEAGYDVCIIRVPITHLDGGGHSHSTMADLAEIRLDHLKVLYETWQPKLHLIGEYYKNEPH